MIQEQQLTPQTEEDNYKDFMLKDFYEINDDQNKKLTEYSVPIYGQDIQLLGRANLLGPLITQPYASFTNFLIEGSFQTVPLIAIDFSLANLTFTDDKCLHSTKVNKNNDYRNVIKAISDSYSNILNIPVFGYSAKTTKLSSTTSSLFPLTQDLKNPFISNDMEVLDQQYLKCLKQLELSTPINLVPLFNLVKQLGVNLRKKVDQTSRIDCFYALYILSSGLIDDLSELIDFIQQDWQFLPIQVHIINLSAQNIQTEDLDVVKFQDFSMKINLQQSCWQQFNVHYYDRIKFKYNKDKEKALNQLKEQIIESVPKEIETYLFVNQLKPNIFCDKSEIAQQSLHNIMDVIIQLNDDLVKQAVERGYQRDIVEQIIDMKDLQEWNCDTLTELIKSKNIIVSVLENDEEDIQDYINL